MRFIKKFFQDLVKYRHFIAYDVKSNLKAELSNTVLGYFWWLLDPLLNMAIYTFLFSIIFKGNDPAYPVYVFSALLLWKIATVLLNRSTTCIRDNAGIIKQVYVPKFVIPLTFLLTNTIKFLVGCLLLFAMFFFFQISFTWHIVEAVVVVFIFLFFFYSLSLIIAHLGVIYEDMRIFMEYIIMFWFFVSPGMWRPEMIPEELRTLIVFNPVATFFTSLRNTMLYGQHPMYAELGIWALVSLVLFVIGINLLYSGDKNYTKVI